MTEMTDQRIVDSNLVYMDNASDASKVPMTKQRLLGRLMQFRCEVDADDGANVLAQIRQHNLQSILMGYHLGKPVSFEAAWGIVYGDASA